MPYAKKPYKKRKTNYLKNSATVASTAYTALKIAQGIQRMVNTEVKHTDISYSSGALTTSGQVFNLCAPSKGDTFETRDGISVKPLNLKIQGRFHMGTGVEVEHVRVIIFRGKQENAVVPVTTDVLDTANVFSFKNYSDRFRTKILSDKILTLKPWESTSYGSANYNLSKKLFGHINFVEGADTIENGGLYMLVLSSSTATPATYMTVKTRVTWTDN